MLPMLTCLLIAAAPTSPRYVFAHYMVAIPTYGGDSKVEDYMREIQAAQSRGIDGFALNCGGWTAREPHYKARTLLIYEAAKRLNSGFKLFVSADYCCGLTLDETKDILTSLADHPNQFQVGGKPLLSTFTGEGADNQQGRDLCAFLDRLGGDKGRACVFVPYFYPRPNVTEHPSPEVAAQVLRDHPTLDGFFYFGAAGTDTQLASSNRNCAKAWLGAGKLFMACATPYYRGLGGNYRCFETNGFEGFAKQFVGAIEDQATWIEIVTWNDWGEASYVAPFGEPSATELWGGHWGKILSHVAYLDAMRYYIDWYKTGQAPKITADKLFYAYRPHPKALLGPTKARPGGADALLDKVFVTVYLTAPATLTVTSGDAEQRFDLTAGVKHVALDAKPGAQRFRLMRGGATLVDKTGELPISADEAFGNFNMFAGQS
ncbi:MAG: glycoside hydrolase family 71 [Armatimonadetes bacterium]|nr:glycoside hydrolase family 71 [Armatimonadota bacterium]